MSLFSILLGGELTVTPRVAALSAGARGLAAGSGLPPPGAPGLAPPPWGGGFPSSSADDFEKHRNVPRETFPSAKDKTDGELAIDIAIARGASSLLILGAFGGERADHEFLHLALALRLAERGFDVTLSSGTQEGRPVLPGAHSFDHAYGTLFSILGFTDIEGLSIQGAEWPLDRIHMEFGSSLTISNRVTGPLTVMLGKGRAMLVTQTLDRS